jgi:hypothetical protein
MSQCRALCRSDEQGADVNLIFDRVIVNNSFCLMCGSCLMHGTVVKTCCRVHGLVYVRQAFVQSRVAPVDFNAGIQPVFARFACDGW